MKKDVASSTEARSMRQALKIYSSRVIKYVTNLDIPPDPPKKEWVLKHPEIKLNLKKEVDLSDEEWRESSFPYRDLPSSQSYIKMGGEIQKLIRYRPKKAICQAKALKHKLVILALPRLKKVNDKMS